jgi:LmbE family N-acetylglucosaminyl deacetylase
MKRRTVLAIGAHPDDLEVLCGGTLALYSRHGWRVVMYHVTDGSKGGLDKAPERIREERSREAIDAAGVIGALSAGGGFADGEVSMTLESRSLLVDVVREYKPQVILTHHPRDYHPDHMSTSKLVLEAIYMVGIPNLRTQHTALDYLPHLYYFDTVVGIHFEPELFVDISEVIELKREMMRRHTSQLSFVQEHHGIDFLDMIEITGRYRGYQCNVRYAEGFVEARGWPRGVTERVLPGASVR